MPAGSSAVLLVVVLSAVGASEQDDSPSRAARLHLERARVHLRFGVAEHGNLTELDAAQRELEAVELPPAQGDKSFQLAAETRALQIELQRLREVAGMSFDGRFPLVGAIDVIRQTSDSAYTRPSRLPDVAPRLAIRSALSQIARQIPSDQADVVLLLCSDASGTPLTEQGADWVESEAATVLEWLPNVRLQPVGTAMPPLATSRWDAPDAEFASICQAALAAIGGDAPPRNLVLLLVRSRSPLPTNEYWFQAQCRIFDSSAIQAIVGNDQAAKIEASMHVSEGLCRDASAWTAAIVACQGLLLLAALASYATVLIARRQVVSSKSDWIVPPLIGYVLGLALPHAVASVMHRFLPPVATAWLTSLWWPALTGTLVLLLPSVVFRVAARSLTVVPGARRLEGRWGAALVSVALGVGAFWCGPALIYLGPKSFAVLVPFVLAGGLLSYCFGRAIDPGDRFPLGTAPLAIALALPLGAGIFAASSAVLWTCGLMVLSLAIAANWRATATAASAQTKLPESHGNDRATAPHSLEELRSRVQSAFYLPEESLDRAREVCQQAGGRQVVWLGICGPSGSGKTALIERLLAELAGSDRKMRVLTGDCRAQAAPYQPFRQALAEVWESVSPATVQPEATGIDSVFQELAGLFVPYWDLLSVVADPAAHTAVSPSDLHAAVAIVLRKLTKKQRVALLIDNIQWLDEGSAALVRHLHRHFPPGGGSPLMVILVGRQPADFDKLDVDLRRLIVAPPSRDRQVSLLEQSLGFERRSAQAIVKSLGAVSDEPGGIFWLSRTVCQLLDQNAIAPGEQGFVLPAELLDKGKLPLPSDLREALAARLRESPDDLLVVQCAALLGHVFRVSILAASLRKDRLELLHVLQRLERESRVFEDVVEHDDEYAFCSLFMYQVVCELLELPADEATPTRPRKIVMEICAHIARALEEVGGQPSNAVFELADYYCQAGSLYAAKALEYALAAARLGRSQFAYRQARRHLAMAAAAARTAGKPLDDERELLLVDCDEAHVTGRHRQAVAEHCRRFIMDRALLDNETVLIAARSCYDAGRDSGDAAWFNNAAHFAGRVLDGPATEIERAEACHLLGISLPLTQRAERVDRLRQGLKMVEGLSESRAALLLQARLLGSLAEQLSAGPPAEREEARSLFERGLDLRIVGQLGDLPGQARAYGGLGRLAFYADPPDYDQARRSFLADLKIADMIDDSAGQSIAHSFLGKCDLAAGNPAGAWEHFAAAKVHSQSTKDTLFALAGMLECSLQLGRTDDVDRTRDELITLTKAPSIPADCADEIARVLKLATRHGAADQEPEPSTRGFG